jgi:putative ABC transport system permease protein
MHQFGILASIGATPKQLRNSVLFEGLCIGAVGIPLGTLVGLLSIQIVITIVAKNFRNILYANIPLTVTLSVPILLAAAAVSLITILISAYIPAKKAASTPVMESIRQSNEVKISPKDMKMNAFSERLYGLEGMLALKNFKRNKKRYRTIVLSLALSVILFVSARSFASNMQESSKHMVAQSDYDIVLTSSELPEQELLHLYK